MSAVISPCGRYRYRLDRQLVEPDPEHQMPTALFIMLNPSTADDVLDDQTIRRCITFAQREGCDRLTVVNLFALRSTNPAALETAADPIGPENDAYLAQAIQGHSGIVIAAWGAHAIARARGEALNAKYGPFLCLGTTLGRAPRHPLYVRADHPLERYIGSGQKFGYCSETRGKLCTM